METGDRLQNLHRTVTCARMISIRQVERVGVYREAWRYESANVVEQAAAVQNLQVSVPGQTDAARDPSATW